MIKEHAKVVACERDYIWVVGHSKPACSACSSSGSCGVGALGTFFQGRDSRLRVFNAIGAKEGDEVILAISESTLLQAAVVAYLLPLLAMIAAALGAAMHQVAEMEVAVSAVIGLAAGIAVSRLLAMSGLWFQPELQRAGVNAVLEPIHPSLCKEKETTE